MATKTIFMLAGEVSGDRLGAGLMRALRRKYGAQHFIGVGGAQMTAQGLVSRFAMDEIALMGLHQIVPRIPFLLRRIRQLAQYIVESRPNAIVLIDSPDFTHRLARAVHRRSPDLPMIVYAAPTVWGWRASRAAAMRVWCRHVMALLPFEPKVFRHLRGPSCDYVGHPALYDLPQAKQVAQWREAHQLGNRPLLAVLPGSRRNEIKSLAPIFRNVATQCQRAIPDLAIAILVAAPVRAQLQTALASWRADVAPPIIVESEAAKPLAGAAANLALAASGTAVLELALAGTPSVGAYAIDPFLLWWLGRTLKVPSVLLPNLILDAPVLPEFLGERCRADLLTAEVLAILQSAARQQALTQALGRLAKTMAVKEEFPQERAAQLVWQAAI